MLSLGHVERLSREATISDIGFRMALNGIGGLPLRCQACLMLTDGLVAPYSWPSRTRNQLPVSCPCSILEVYVFTHAALVEQHDIILNGYNLGRLDLSFPPLDEYILIIPARLLFRRDWLIGNITDSEIPTMNLTDGMQFSGTTSWANYTYHTDIKMVYGILPNTSDAINHNWTVAADGINASDGMLAVFNVQIVGEPAKSCVAVLHSLLPTFSWKGRSNSLPRSSHSTLSFSLLCRSAFRVQPVKAWQLHSILAALVLLPSLHFVTL